jgi:hypothetical protein
MELPGSMSKRTYTRSVKEALKSHKEFIKAAGPFIQTIFFPAAARPANGHIIYAATRI